MATTYTDSTMGARAIGARTDNVGAGVTDVSAEEDRYSQIILAEGWIKPANSFVPAAGAAATMNVLIGSGTAKADYYCVAGDIAGQGQYLVRLAAATQTITLNAADGALPRKDELYLVVLDNAYDSTGLALPRFAYRDGTPNASPSAPGPDGSWDAYVLLATIDVPAAAADILACSITDERIASTLAIGNFASDTSATPNVIEPDDSAAEGTAKTFSRSDHEHGIVTAAAGTIEPDDASAEGVATSFSRSDHQHAIAAAAPSSLTPDLANSEGAATSFARSDHIHNVPAGTPGTITPDASAAEGSAASFARSDHTHGISAGAPSTLNPDQSNAEGTASSFARSDHVHNVPAAAPVAIGTANSEGAGTSFARNNHVHAITDARDVAVTAGQATTGAVASGLGTSWGDEATVAFSLPAGWTSALVVAWGSGGMEASSVGGVELSGRIEFSIAGNGTEVGSGGSAAGEEQTVACSHSATLTASQNVHMGMKVSSGPQDLAFATVAYIAIRAS